MENILELKNIVKSFDDKKIHQGLTFTLKHGETIGLLGRSGTGKSVLLRSIIGLEQIDSGEILFHEQRLDLLTEQQLYPVRTRISYSFQNAALFDSISVFENLAYPLFEHTNLAEAEVEKRVMEALQMVDLTESRDLMPSDLSGGMQKRIGMARAMILNPEILLFDEPTAGLDPVNIEMVIETIEKFKAQGISGILVTHDISTAKRVCDRILILNEGKIGFTGTVDEFEGSDDPFVKSFLL